MYTSTCIYQHASICMFVNAYVCLWGLCGVLEFGKADHTESTSGWHALSIAGEKIK